MEISIRGKTECLTKTEIRKIFDFLCKYFLGKRLSKYIFIEVEFKFLNTVFGLCEPTDYDYKNHREFSIQIKKNMTRIKTIKTIIHEMVHVRQYARKHFKQISIDEYKWMGKNMIMQDLDYHKMPWEIEACSYEKPVYQECKQLLE